MIDKPVQYLKGVGPSRSRLLSRLGIFTINDLLTCFPRDYEDRRAPLKIAAAQNGQKVFISGKVELAQTIKLNNRLSVFKAAVSDGTGIVYALFYRKTNPYFSHDIFAALKKDFVQGAGVSIAGTFEADFGEKRVNAEEYEIASGEKQGFSGFGRIVPVYRLTEGLNQKWFRKIVFSALSGHAREMRDPVPKTVSASEKLPALHNALAAIHFPDEKGDSETARRRIAFGEFLTLETALGIAKDANGRILKGHSYNIYKNLLTPFRGNLGFEFTKAQKKVINEIFSDMQRKKPMNRLLLGDVGSGKTVVAVSAMLLAAENKLQSVLLAPTEILAEQHYLSLKRLLSGLQVNAALLTGRGTKPSEKRALREGTMTGKIDIIVGTHALLGEKLMFKKLGLAVIDEQHRFGVLQRASVQAKSENPDILVMTATPIPRTLALTAYGDLDISIIDSLPPGRKPVETLFLSEEKAYESVKREVSKGRQAFIVYPLIEESDKIELKAAVKEAKTLADSVFKGLKIGLMHGQLNAKEKERIMIEFRSGAYDLLISTTVIEVGIDVPNAAVMVIEHAERFGLATLHQLRGRIGRGTEKSYCILVGDPKTEDASRRIDIMLSSTDGFRIAEEDLALRGPGEFFGTSQHGLPELKAGNILRDTKLIEKCRAAAREIRAHDPGLSAPANSGLREELMKTYAPKLGLSKIG